MRMAGLCQFYWRTCLDLVQVIPAVLMKTWFRSFQLSWVFSLRLSRLGSGHSSCIDEDLVQVVPAVLSLFLPWDHLDLVQVVPAVSSLFLEIIYAWFRSLQLYWWKLGSGRSSCVRVFSLRSSRLLTCSPQRFTRVRKHSLFARQIWPYCYNLMYEMLFYSIISS